MKKYNYINLNRDISPVGFVVDSFKSVLGKFTTNHCDMLYMF